MKWTKNAWEEVEKRRDPRSKVQKRVQKKQRTNHGFRVQKEELKEGELRTWMMNHEGDQKTTRDAHAKKKCVGLEFLQNEEMILYLLMHSLEETESEWVEEMQYPKRWIQNVRVKAGYDREECRHYSSAKEIHERRHSLNQRYQKHVNRLVERERKREAPCFLLEIDT